jgi:hypothetical protein
MLQRALQSLSFRSVRIALRRLAHSPGFTLFSVLSLALGLAISAAFYAVMSAVLWPASGMQRADQLAVLSTSGVGDRPDVRPEIPRYARADFDDFRAS